MFVSAFSLVGGSRLGLRCFGTCVCSSLLLVSGGSRLGLVFVRLCFLVSGGSGLVFVCLHFLVSGGSIRSSLLSR